jgi:hypothetical protein
MDLHRPPPNAARPKAAQTLVATFALAAGTAEGLAPPDMRRQADRDYKGRRRGAKQAGERKGEMRQVPEVPAPSAYVPPDRPWRWSIAEAWSWLAHTWHDVMQAPYLGVASLVLAGLLALLLLTRLLHPR